jgi:hypothetical protein
VSIFTSCVACFPCSNPGTSSQVWHARQMHHRRLCDLNAELLLGVIAIGAHTQPLLYRARVKQLPPRQKYLHHLLSHHWHHLAKNLDGMAGRREGSLLKAFDPTQERLWTFVSHSGAVKQAVRSIQDGRVLLHFIPIVSVHCTLTDIDS